MTFEVEANGRTMAVSIERTDHPGQFRIALDGVAHVVDVARTAESGLSLRSHGAGMPVPSADPSRPGKRTAVDSTDLQIWPGAAPGEVVVALRGRTIGVTVNGRRASRGADATSHGHGELAIVAPMPGRIVRVLAAAGDEVSARQGIIVVEAMKMENELRTPRAGRVREVTVTPGTSVEAGRVLAVIE